MAGLRRPPSIAFQLWFRLGAAMVAFTLLVFPVYLWVEMEERIDAAFSEAMIRADVVGGALKSQGRPRPPAAGDGAQPQRPAGARGRPLANFSTMVEEVFIDSLGLWGVQLLSSDGSVEATSGDLDGPAANAPVAFDDGDPAGGRRHGATIDDGDLSAEHIDPIDLLLAGNLAVVVVLPPPPGDGPAAGGLRVIVDISHLSGDAWTLLARSLVLTAGLLLVALGSLWVLLRYFVSRPLREYGDRARRIARGEPLRLSEGGGREIAELGAAVNSMAEALREQASTDALTGLYNARHFKAEFPALLRDAARERRPLAVLNIDVNDLKPINDTGGHDAGDLVLRALGECLRAWAGGDVMCWRIGGDEFAAALPRAGAPAAERQLRALEAIVAERRVLLRGSEIALSVSIGLAVYPQDAETMPALVAIADRRMYEAKARAKGGHAAA